MFCGKCGTNNADGAKFCAGCGAELTAQAAPETNTYAQPNYNQPNYSQPNYVPPTPPADPGKGLAIAGMVCGIISFFCFAIITGTLGIVFGSVAKSKGSTSGMATAGIVCGAIGVGLWLLLLIFGTSIGLGFNF